MITLQGRSSVFLSGQKSLYVIQNLKSSPDISRHFNVQTGCVAKKNIPTKREVKLCKREKVQIAELFEWFKKPYLPFLKRMLLMGIFSKLDYYHRTRRNERLNEEAPSTHGSAFRSIHTAYAGIVHQTPFICKFSIITSIKLLLYKHFQIL